jgi:hypothetical protein
MFDFKDLFGLLTVMSSNASNGYLQEEGIG